MFCILIVSNNGMRRQVIGPIVTKEQAVSYITNKKGFYKFADSEDYLRDELGLPVATILPLEKPTE